MTGLPLGSAEPRGLSLMLNLIGSLPEPDRALSVPGAHLHVYGKEPRPGRKLGHVTVRADVSAQLDAAERRLAKMLR